MKNEVGIDLDNDGKPDLNLDIKTLICGSQPVFVRIPIESRHYIPQWFPF